MQNGNLSELKITQQQFRELCSFPCVKTTFTYVSANSEEYAERLADNEDLPKYLDYAGIRFVVVPHIPGPQVKLYLSKLGEIV